MANTKAKTEKVDVETTTEDVKVKEETGTISPTRANPIEATAAVSSLIIHLCGEAKARRVRDEYKSYEAIAALMTSLNKG